MGFWVLRLTEEDRFQFGEATEQAFLDYLLIYLWPLIDTEYVGAGEHECSDFSGPPSSSLRMHRAIVMPKMLFFCFVFGLKHDEHLNRLKGLVDIYLLSFLAPLDGASCLIDVWLSAMGLWTLIMSHQFPPTLRSWF